MSLTRVRVISQYFVMLHPTLIDRYYYYRTEFISGYPVPGIFSVPGIIIIIYYYYYYLLINNLQAIINTK